MSMTALTLRAGAALVAASLCTPAMAQVTAADADAAERAIKQWIDEQLLGGNENAVLDFGAGLEVTAEDGRLVGTMPAGRLLIEADNDGVLVIALSEQGFTAEPLDDHRYAVTASWPREWEIALYPIATIPTLAEAMPAWTARMTIGGQSTAMVFDARYQTAMEWDQELLDITLAEDGANVMVTIGRAAMVGDSTPTAAGPHRYDMATTLSLSGVSASSGQDTATIGEFSAVGTVHNVDLLGFRELGEDLQAAQGRLNAAPNDPQAMVAMLEVLGRMPEMLNGFALDLTMSDFEAEAAGFRSFIAEQRLTTALSGLGTQGSTWDLSVSMEGMANEPEVPAQGLMPVDAMIDLAVTGIPNEAIGEAFSRFITSTMAIGPERAAPIMALEIYAAAVDQGAMFDLRELIYRTSIGEIRMDSIVHPDTAAAFGVTASLDMTVEQMGGFAEEAVAVPFFGQGLSDAITALEQIGLPAGETARRYTFELTRDGTMTLNGLPIEDVMNEVFP